MFEATLVLNEVNDTLLASAVGKPPRDESRLFVVGKKIFFLLGWRFVLMGRQGANVPGGENKKALF